MKTRVALAIGLLLLAGCGQREKLKAAPGEGSPPKAATAPAALDTNALLTPPVESRPGRSDDALRKSQERPDDRFNLPPPG
jgi:hypothetical protein